MRTPPWIDEAVDDLEPHGVEIETRPVEPFRRHDSTRKASDTRRLAEIFADFCESHG